MTKVGQVCGLSCLLLAGLLFGGCQTNKADSGFSEVPGVSETAATSHASAPPGATAPGTIANSAVTSTNADSPEIIRPGYILLITFGDLPNQPPAFDQKVKDDGSITLIYNKVFQAAGKRTGDLEREIRDFYVPAYFINLTVTVRIATDTRSYYVEGEVRAPGQRPYISSITVSKAIAAAGGFSDFANKKKVRLIRADGRKETVNCVDVLEHPEKDPQVYPEDKIHVPRRLF